MPAEGLLVYMAQQMIALIIRKGLFSEEYIFFADYMSSSQFLCETGAVLGYTFRDRMTTFVKLFCEPGRESGLVATMGDIAATHLQELKEEPQDFIDFFFKQEATRIIDILREAGLTKASGWSDFSKVSKQKLRAKDVFSQLMFAVPWGIGLGSRFPELAKKLLTNEIDPSEWNYWRSHGLDIPSIPPKPKTIEQRQQKALSLITPYVERTRPDLMISLGLQTTT